MININETVPSAIRELEQSVVKFDNILGCQNPARPSIYNASKKETLQKLGEGKYQSIVSFRRTFAHYLEQAKCWLNPSDPYQRDLQQAKVWLKDALKAHDNLRSILEEHNLLSFAILAVVGSLALFRVKGDDA